MSNTLAWVRERGLAQSQRAIDLAKVANQQASDIATICDALEGFYGHPNVTDEDKALLDAALTRVFTPLIEAEIDASEAVRAMEAS